MNWQVPLADLDYGPEEEEAVLGVLRSRWLTMGAVTKEFEARFAERHGAKHAIAVSNATQALHLACVAAGLGPGDEAIVPSMTFVATANAVRYTGAEVRFADITGPEELTLSPAGLEAAITPQTRAILAMHYAGFPCRMEPIREIAHRKNLFLIEDAAHAPGASLNGRALGTWGDAGCFSFFSNKNLSTGEGGMVLTDRDDVAEKVRLLRSHGMTSLTLDRHEGRAYSYDVIALGYNYRIDEIRSALGLAQLAKLDRNNALRRGFTHRYWEGLEGTGLGLPFLDTAGESSYHIMPVLLPAGVDRQAFIDRLRADGIQTSIHYPPVHLFSEYRARYPDVVLPHTEDAAARELTLPLYPTMGEEKVDIVVEAVKRALG
ncbi:MAG TPA: DegT/DnrJ/EryC1/StrS family aminotransferase [Anaerolineales bacterium]|nr:DegT/DnrJ/EryC1/StrS family aminotransferase [Anaerolineales bacterium]